MAAADVPLLECIAHGHEQVHNLAARANRLKHTVDGHLNGFVEISQLGLILISQLGATTTINTQ